MLSYCEYYFNAQGGDVGFDSEFQTTSHRDLMRIRIRNSMLQLSLEAADRGIAPTQWQWSRHPEVYRPKISVIHDGIDTDRITPPRGSFTLTLPNGETVARGEEVVTYVARNLEPYRGFHTFMRAAEKLLRRRPKTKILVVGGDDVSYGGKPRDGKTWREKMLDEVDLDHSRIHFLGRLPYEKYLSVLKVSAAHVYLTYPFVLSWSVLEAMAMGCLVVGSRTAPVEEVIEDGRNGLLFDFFDPEELAERVGAALDDGDLAARLRQHARQTTIDRFDLHRRCLPQQQALVDSLLGVKPVLRGAVGMVSLK